MHRHLFLSAFLLSSLASSLAYGGSLQQSLKGKKCLKQLTNSARKLGAVEYWWTAHLNPVLGNTFYRTPTYEVGKWLETHMYSDKLRLVQLTEDIELIYDFAFDNCRAKMGFRKRNRTPAGKIKRPRDYFTDIQLRRAIKRHKKGLIIHWTPHMAISIYGLRNAYYVAKQLGLKLIALHELGADKKLVKAVLKRLNLRGVRSYPMVSFHLGMAGIENHHPSIVVFSRGRITSRVFPGHENRKEYVEFVKAHL